MWRAETPVTTPSYEEMDLFSITRTFAALIGVLAVVLLTACATTAPTATPVTPAGVVLPTLAPATPTATAAAPTATPTAPPVGVATPTATPDGPGNGDELLALGKEVFDKTAGGLGCAYCHKADATGDPVLGSPNIQGVTADQIWAALDTRAQMTFITMTEQEVDAVTAYLGTLGSQP